MFLKSFRHTFFGIQNSFIILHKSVYDFKSLYQHQISLYQFYFNQVSTCVTRLKPDKSFVKLEDVKTVQLLQDDYSTPKKETNLSLCHSETGYTSSVKISDNAPILKNYLLMSDFDYCKDVLKENV